jgi:tetratricopeptide (TPR) repeat protein
VAAYTRSISADPTVAKVLSKRAKVYVLQQELANAESDTARALLLNQSCIDTRLLYGTIMMSLGCLRAAIVKFDIILQRRPNDKKVLALRSESQSKLARANGLKGNILFLTCDFHGAMAELSSSIALDNSNGAVRRAHVSLQMRDEFFDKCHRVSEEQLAAEFSRAAQLDGAKGEFRDWCAVLEERDLSVSSQESVPMDAPYL